MKPFLISSSKVTTFDVSKFDQDPAFRKATKNMIMCTSAIQNVLQQNPLIDLENLPLIISTHFGEVESTLEFLSSYKETKIPRPILFQNSLHNSTLGFVSINLKIKGPAMTISADHLTVQATADCAETLLESNDYVLVCFVDYIPEILIDGYLKYHGFLKEYLNQASAFLIAKNKISNHGIELTEQLKNFKFLI